MRTCYLIILICWLIKTKSPLCLIVCFQSLSKLLNKLCCTLASCRVIPHVCYCQIGSDVFTTNVILLIMNSLFSPCDSYVFDIEYNSTALTMITRKLLNGQYFNVCVKLDSSFVFTLAKQQQDIIQFSSTNRRRSNGSHRPI